MTHEEFIAEIEKMTVLELNDLSRLWKRSLLFLPAASGCGRFLAAAWRCCSRRRGED